VTLVSPALGFKRLHTYHVAFPSERCLVRAKFFSMKDLRHSRRGGLLMASYAKIVLRYHQPTRMLETVGVKACSYTSLTTGQYRRLRPHARTEHCGAWSQTIQYILQAANKLGCNHPRSPHLTPSRYSHHTLRSRGRHLVTTDPLSPNAEDIQRTLCIPSVPSERETRLGYLGMGIRLVLLALGQ
jgi:hypothetical protein